MSNYIGNTFKSAANWPAYVAYDWPWSGLVGCFTENARAMQRLMTFCQ